MKKINLFPILGIFLLCQLIVSCSNEPKLDDSSAMLEVSSFTANSAELVLRAQNISEFAWSVLPDNETISDANVLFATGTVSACTEGDNVFTISGLEPLTQYTVSVALKVGDGRFFEDILNASFTTGDYTEPLTLVNATDDGVTIHVKVPEDVKNRKNVLRYNIADLVMYRQNKGSMLDAQMLLFNGQRILTQDTTITYNDANINLLDEEGNEVIGDDGEPIYMHDPYVPGEPLVFCVGEYGIGESEFGWGNGWYNPMFDYDKFYSGMGTEEECWTGYFNRIEVQTIKPGKLDADMEISVEAKPVSAVLTVTPDENIKQYCVMVTDNALYDMVCGMLDNNPDYIQWFVTSFYGANVLGSITLEGPAKIDLENYIIMDPDTEYHVMITAMGDEKGLTQCYKHYSFTTPQKSMSEPKVVVTAISNPNGEESPFEVWFNVKSPSKDIVSAKYAANYERDWAAVLNQMNYSDVVEMGMKFTQEEVAQINSDEGLNVSFSSLDNSTTIVAVKGYNEESTPNNLDVENATGIARNSTIKRPHLDKVESTLYSDLAGEWTATYKVAKLNYYNNTYEEQKDPMQVKVNISDGISYPEKLTEDVYPLYPDKTKEEVDALYEEFKREAEEYNAKVRGQNAIVCLGFAPGYETATPYDLFVSPDYNGYNNASLFFDFGPKWYLQLAKDGSVSVPINYYKMFPSHAWTQTMYYVMGLDKESQAINAGDNKEDLNFPVKISEDKNTITWSPIEHNSSLYYPNLIYIMQVPMVGNEYKIISEITLTRGWNGTATESVTSSMSIPVSSGKKAISPYKRKTPLKAFVHYEKASIQILEADEAQKRLDDYFATVNKK